MNRKGSAGEDQDVNNTLVLRVLAAVGLFGLAAVHLKIAGNYDGLGKDPLALDDQFYAQAAAGIVLGIAVLVRPHLLVWLAALGLAVSSLAVLTYSRYKSIPIYGFDGGFQESWDASGAKLAAAFEGLAVLATGAGAALSYKAFTATRTS